MANGVKFVKRNRTRVGRAGGGVVCTIDLPAIGEHFDRRFQFIEKDTKLAKLSRFLQKELGRAESVIENGSAKVEAFVRMPSGRLGRRVLARWRAGEPVERCLSATREAWRRLPKEEGWAATVAVDVSPPTDGTAARGRKPAV